MTRGKASEDGGVVKFYCDAMLGGLARWLRAAGYDAAYDYGIDDGVLVERARRSGRMILSSDGPLFDRRAIASGQVEALFIPRDMNKLQQLEYVIRELDLPPREARCMGCGGELADVPRHEAAAEAPPLAFKHCGRFWRCRRCGKLLWRGTHWRGVQARLEATFAKR